MHFLETERKPNKEIQTSFQKKFKALVSKKDKNVLLNAMRLYNERRTIIKSFKDRDIKPFFDKVEKSKQEFDESIEERVKLRRGKTNNNNKQPNTTDMPDLETEKFAEQREKQEAKKGLKVLTPTQMLTRLTISLAQLEAGNNSEKLKNEIKQLLFSLYRSKKVLIYLMDLILFLMFKIILNTSSKNMKLLQMIVLYKFM